MIIDSVLVSRHKTQLLYTLFELSCYVNAKSEMKLSAQACIRGCMYLTPILPIDAVNSWPSSVVIAYWCIRTTHDIKGQLFFKLYLKKMKFAKFSSLQKSVKSFSRTRLNIYIFIVLHKELQNIAIVLFSRAVLLHRQIFFGR